MLKKLVLVAALLCVPAGAFGQALPRTVLVLDGSGSMWGQIDGVAKMTIAQDVMAELVGSLPPEQTVGLVAYGHNRRGDCSDIETLVAPATGNRDTIIAAARAISPKGRTPLSAAVLHAADQLRYTEDEATVILLSDGIETCDLDPCAVGRDLEAAGIDFTAHVIGFDVTDAEGQAQLQCLADETGGLYRDAGNADELLDALTELASAPAPAPEPLADITLVATNGEGGDVIAEPLLWEIVSIDAAHNPDVEEASLLTRQLLPGGYLVRVSRLASEGEVTEATVRIQDQTSRRIEIALPRLLPEATVTAPEQAAVGSQIAIAWTGPGSATDRIELRAPGAARAAASTAVGQTGTARLIMPSTPGPYEVVYVMDDGDVVLASVPIVLTEAPVQLDFAPSVEAGYPVEVAWSGPGNSLDYIRIVYAGTTDTLNEASTRRSGSASGVAVLGAPAEPGVYDVIYYFDQDRTVLARSPLIVSQTRGSLTAPVEAAAGSEITVEWTGPGNTLDRILLRKPFDPRAIVSAGVRGNSGSVTIELPAEPDTYELVYLLNATRQVLLSANITVTANP